MSRAQTIQPTTFRFAHHLLRLRRERGETQLQIAARAGVSNVTLHHIEVLESNPSLETAARLAAALDTTIEAMLAPPQECTHPVSRKTKEGWCCLECGELLTKAETQ